MCIFDSIDRLSAKACPRKLLYAAIDGVALRAKMKSTMLQMFSGCEDAAGAAEEEG